MAQLPKALLWVVQGKGWEQIACGRKCRKALQQLQLRLVYSVSEQTLKHKPAEINEAQ